MSTIPPYAKAPYNINGVSITNVVPGSTCREIRLVESKGTTTGDLKIEYPVGTGFQTWPAGVEIPIIATLGYRFTEGVACARIQAADPAVVIEINQTERL